MYSIPEAICTVNEIICRGASILFPEASLFLCKNACISPPLANSNTKKYGSENTLQYKRKDKVMNGIECV